MQKRADAALFQANRTYPKCGVKWNNRSAKAVIKLAVLIRQKSGAILTEIKAYD